MTDINSRPPSGNGIGAVQLFRPISGLISRMMRDFGSCATLRSFRPQLWLSFLTRSGRMPACYNLATINSILKVPKPSEPSHYRPISPLPPYFPNAWRELLHGSGYYIPAIQRKTVVLNLRMYLDGIQCGNDPSRQPIIEISRCWIRSCPPVSDWLREGVRPAAS